MLFVLYISFFVYCPILRLFSYSLLILVSVLSISIILKTIPCITSFFFSSFFISLSFLSSISRLLFCFLFLTLALTSTHFTLSLIRIRMFFVFLHFSLFDVSLPFHLLSSILPYKSLYLPGSFLRNENFILLHLLIIRERLCVSNAMANSVSGHTLHFHP